ncbi:NAD(P)-binding protein [Gonapodya prolifera JEL478]|uniref:NAD(P)-binding protein n=1 Tax=Gonapodya prolifera (strain JEL478) TaxID=1344416 RepID=A0A139A031_GONPJ|nr:NAD(P)-binding protein [Gonapodya prolifera JEL478]|eukprot:KXS09895.1 NAD(P)-binding protein [Gonapodya prolifera JEL478]
MPGLELLKLPFPKVDILGRVVIVTGANNGVGLYTTANLAQLGATVIMACRNLKKAEEARQQVIATVPDSTSRIFVRHLDLSDFSSVKTFATGVMKEWDTVDVLINNAGIVGQKTRETTVDGNEVSFQTNHLSHFLLTNLLLPVLQRSTYPARIVNVASMAAYPLTKLNIDDLNFEKHYPDIFELYPKTKLSNYAFTAELSRRLATSPSLSHISTSTVCPGFVITGLGVNVDEAAITAIREKGGARPGHEGAFSSVYAACSVEAGEAPKGEWRFYDTYAVKQELHPVAKDEEVGRRLWEESRRLVGRFGGEVTL